MEFFSNFSSVRFFSRIRPPRPPSPSRSRAPPLFHRKLLVHALIIHPVVSPPCADARPTFARGCGPASSSHRRRGRLPRHLLRHAGHLVLLRLSVAAAAGRRQLPHLGWLWPHRQRREGQSGGGFGFLSPKFNSSPNLTVNVATTDHRGTLSLSRVLACYSRQPATAIVSVLGPRTSHVVGTVQLHSSAGAHADAANAGVPCAQARTSQRGGHR